MCPSRLSRSTQVVTESTAVLLTQEVLAMALLLPGGPRLWRLPLITAVTATNGATAPKRWRQEGGCALCGGAKKAVWWRQEGCVVAPRRLSGGASETIAGLLSLVGVGEEAGTGGRVRAGSGVGEVGGG
eukprot:COSAG02_NODE_6357_length_3627_cov_11.172052_6_plen_129_part_00